MAIIADRLRELRNSAGLSQQALADKTSISKSSINMYERGAREPGLETVEVFADFFNVDLDYLFGKSDIPRKSFIESNTPIITFEENNLLTQYRELDQYGKETVNAVLECEHNRCAQQSVIFRAANSAENHAPEITTTTKDFSKIKQSDDDTI